jgi:UDPglucose 6-dehydrogenase
MATVAILGGGHVGLVHAAGLSELGHVVRVVDLDAARVERLRAGDVPFEEPGLRELTARNVTRRRLSFTTSYPEGLSGAGFVFLCVPTPTSPTGELDVRALRIAVTKLAGALSDPPPILINKSTVPVGTAEVTYALLGGKVPVVSNPEFLAEGRAMSDFFHPSRIVLGARDRTVAEAVAGLYHGFAAPIVYTDNATAEYSKLASNAFLATKISFANVLARLAECVHADVDALTQVLALDPRIGRDHIRAGLGFGGSCFPKDVSAIEQLARAHDVAPEVFEAVLRVNREQRHRVVAHLTEALDGVGGRRIAILGLAFKAGTDDVREAPAVAIAMELLALRADVVVYDPQVTERITNGPTAATHTSSALDAAGGADAVIFATEWPELIGIDLMQLRAVMRGRILVDGRGMIPAKKAREVGFDYWGFGRGGRRPASRVTEEEVTHGQVDAKSA